MSATQDENIPVVQGSELDEEPVIVSAEDYQNMDEELNPSKPNTSSDNSTAKEPSNNPTNDDKKDVKEEEENANDYTAFDEPVIVPSTATPKEKKKKKREKKATDEYQALEPEYEVVKQQPTKIASKVKRCNDIFWGSLFIVHILLVIAYLALHIRVSLLNNKGFPNYLPTVLLVVVMGIVSTVSSTIALTTMMRYAGNFVKTALMMSVGISLLMGISGFILGQIGIGFIGFVCFVIGICYSKVVWHRIPYAAANLRTALTAVRLNWSTIALAYQVQFVGLLFCVLFFIGVQNAHSNFGIILLFLFSFYWVHQVCKNIIHVTVAGVIGAWWYVPNNESNILSESLCQASTYSFGSICFGSLLTAIIKSIRGTINFARQNDDCSSCVCILECTLKCVENIVEYFNKWAYVYIGLYGFNYLDAGRNVLSLFEHKGWTVLIADDLVDNVLFVCSIGVGITTGILGWAITKINIDIGIHIGHPSSSGFLVGFLMGFLFASIVNGVVGSAVNTVIVCYVESPTEFSENYPQLFAEMRSAWQEAWPDEF